MLSCNYVLLDAARIGSDIAFIKENYPDQGKSLYQGKALAELEDVSPFLFQLSDTDSLSLWFKDKAWGKAMGVLVFSPVNFEKLHAHCRKFILVRTEDQQEMYFRFYDPRVLRIFLPTCTPAQLREFFGPIDFFILEDEDPEYLLKFQLDREHLKTSRFLLTEALASGDNFPLAQSLEFSKKEVPFHNPEPEITIVQPHSNSEQNKSESKQDDKPKKKWNDFFFDE